MDFNLAGDTRNYIDLLNSNLKFTFKIADPEPNFLAKLIKHSSPHYITHPKAKDPPHKTLNKVKDTKNHPKTNQPYQKHPPTTKAKAKPAAAHRHQQTRPNNYHLPPPSYTRSRSTRTTQKGHTRTTP
jgi:hypothetical protein